METNVILLNFCSYSELKKKCRCATHFKKWVFENRKTSFFAKCIQKNPSACGIKREQNISHYAYITITVKINGTLKSIPSATKEGFTQSPPHAVGSEP